MSPQVYAFGSRFQGNSERRLASRIQDGYACPDPMPTLRQWLVLVPLVAGGFWMSALADSTQDERLARADRLERGRQFDEAAAIYDDLLQAGGGRDARWNAYVLYRLSLCQYQSGDAMAARESLLTALAIDPDEPAYGALRRRLDRELGDVPDNVYRCTRDVGSAGRLARRVGVLHVLVRGRNTLSWDRDNELALRRAIRASDDWIQARAREQSPSVSVTIAHRFLATTNEPFWRTFAVPEPEMGGEYRDSWLAAVPPRFRAASLAHMFDDAFDGADFDQRAIAFHVVEPAGAFRGPSVRPLMAPSDIETVWIGQADRERLAARQAVRYSRALFFLFGADDLSDKNGAGIPEHELMNVAAHRIDGCVLHPLTRYAVGWQEKRPELKGLRVIDLGRELKDKENHT